MRFRELSETTATGSMIQHLALVTTEILPRSPQPAAGGGIRIWGLGESLRRQGVRCTYFLEERHASTIQPTQEMSIRFYKPELLHEELVRSGCDAALFEQWQPMTFLQRPLEIPLLVDMPGPLILEYFYRDPRNLHQHIVHKLNCLSKADYYLCAHPRQRGYYAAWLTWAGVSPEDVHRFGVVPFTLHEMPYARQGFVEDEPIFFWGGMFWPWQDRIEAFQRIVSVLEHYRQGQMVVLGELSGDERLDPYRSYLEHPHVSWQGLFGFTEYVYELKRSAVSVDLCRTTQERTLSSDLRTGTALWSGTPCIVTPESAWADLINQHNAGWIVEYSDEKTQRELFAEIALNRVDIVAKRRGARKAAQCIWQDENTAPLIDWLKNPSKRELCLPFHDARFKDRENRLKEIQAEIDRMKHENFELQHDLDNIRKKPLFKFYKSLKMMLGK